MFATKTIPGLVKSANNNITKRFSAGTITKAKGFVSAVSTYNTFKHFSTSTTPVVTAENPENVADIPTQTIHPQTTELLKPPRPIPHRELSTFRYQTPVETITNRDVIYKDHTQIPSIQPKYQIPSPSPPSENFQWSPQMVEFSKKIFQNGYTHELRRFNPYLFLQWEGHHVGGLEMEVFHKNLEGHPTHPESIGNLLQDLIPPDSVISNHPALPIPHPDDGLPVAGSSIAICHAGPFTNGPPGRVHGGLIASIFDVIGYRNVEMVGRKTVTANLNVNYKSSIPIGNNFVTFTSTRLTGERKAFTHMAMFNTEMTELYAEATGLYITPKEWVGKETFDYAQEIQAREKKE